MSETSKWQNAGAGPRQVKDLGKAVSALRSEGMSHDELYGVIGGDERRSTLISFGAPVRSAVAALDQAIKDKYGAQVTRQNVRAIIADYEAALPEARESRRTVDQRRTPEQDAELTAAAAARAAEVKASQDAQTAVLDQVMAKAPAGAKALIIAEWHEDNSDPMTDYFNSVTTRTVAIGFRFSAREDFRALRAAAGQWPETAHLAAGPDVEYRENYSMGGGNYLSDHGSSRSGTGWVVKSREFPCKWAGLTEDAIPDAPAMPAAAAAPGGDGGTVTVSPSSLGRAGVVEVRFTDRPADDVIAGLKAHGFRWARGNRCWYGTDTAYAESLAAPADGTGGATPDRGEAPAVKPRRATRISEDVLGVLSRATVDGNTVSISERLDRAMYVKVNDVLAALGGKWNRKAQAHLFAEDAGPLLAAVQADGTVVRPQDEGWFPTPAPVVADMLELAGLQPGMRVLEPSAGEGAIAGPVAGRGCVVDCVEANAKRADGLRAGGYARAVTTADFLAVPAEPVYDRVIMNPPFADKADIAHVTHALGFLRPGGMLIAVMAGGVMFREDRATAGFRGMVDEAGGLLEPLPEDAFREAGTGVRTVLAVIPAAAERAEAAA